jgi:TPR repeat protein
MKPATILLILGLIAPLFAGAQDMASLEQMRQAAARGSDAAQLEMGILYEFGYNMPKNEINALAWYQVSAERGNTLAAKRRDLLKAKMKPEDIEAANKLARELVSGKAGTAEASPAADKQPDTVGTPPPSEPAGEKPDAPNAAGEKPPSSP